MTSYRNKNKLAATLNNKLTGDGSGRTALANMISTSNSYPKTPNRSILNKNMDVWYDGELKFTIKEADSREWVRGMIDWCFKNTKERFVMYGFNEIHFEDDADVVAFKLHFGGA